MNRSFVYQADFKEYGIGAQILRDLGVRKMRLLTNNKKHLVGLRGYGLEVTSLVPIPRDQSAARSRQAKNEPKRSAPKTTCEIAFRAGARTPCRSSNTAAAVQSSFRDDRSLGAGKNCLPQMPSSAVEKQFSVFSSPASARQLRSGWLRLHAADLRLH